MDSGCLLNLSEWGDHEREPDDRTGDETELRTTTDYVISIRRFGYHSSTISVRRRNKHLSPTFEYLNG